MSANEAFSNAAHALVIPRRVSGNGQTVIPSEIRRIVGVKEGDTLLWIFDPETKTVQVKKHSIGG